MITSVGFSDQNNQMAMKRLAGNKQGDFLEFVQQVLSTLGCGFLR